MTLELNTLIFLLKKWEKLLTHFQQKYWRILDINVWNFNETLTNDVVSFEQTRPWPLRVPSLPGRQTGRKRRCLSLIKMVLYPYTIRHLLIVCTRRADSINAGWLYVDHAHFAFVLNSTRFNFYTGKLFSCSDQLWYVYSCFEHTQIPCVLKQGVKIHIYVSLQFIQRGTTVCLMGKVALPNRIYF